MNKVLSPLRQSCQRRARTKDVIREINQGRGIQRCDEVSLSADSALTKVLGDLLCDELLAQKTISKLTSKQGHALVALARQAIHSCIDYATLGLGWDHPQTRTAYWDAEGQSFSNLASRRRRAKSRKSLAALSTNMASASKNSQREDLLVTAFCKEIGLAAGSVPDASFGAVADALRGELLLPLRALREGLSDMTRTFSGMPVPRASLQNKVDAVTRNVLKGSFSEWRYSNPVGQAQLRGLSKKQIELWREATVSKHDGLVVHEDAPGELGFFWATKIGGPSHGFDFGGQCLLPLLCNARHKVLLLSDPTHWPHPCGRAHLRLLWIAGTEPPKPIMWLEALNVDFAADKAGVNTEGWQEAALRHLIEKADHMGVAVSVDTRLGPIITWIIQQPGHNRKGEGNCKGRGKVREVRDRLVLRPSNGVVEASDYLSRKHDWVQTEEEITERLHRLVYEPSSCSMASRT